ncbi:MAG: hypothetical protein ACFFFB_16705 [Candidatus Heimdallarchaeota archaeon]
MTQESWKYLINGSYVMLASLLLPIGYNQSVFIYPFPYRQSIFIWMFCWVWLDGAIRIRWFFWFPALIQALIIIVGAIIIIISARMVKQGKKINKGTFTLVIYLQIATLLINLISNFLFSRIIIPFFGYISFLFGLILLVIGNKKYYKESTNSRNMLES